MNIDRIQRLRTTIKSRMALHTWTFYIVWFSCSYVVMSNSSCDLFLLEDGENWRLVSELCEVEYDTRGGSRDVCISQVHQRDLTYEEAMDILAECQHEGNIFLRKFGTLYSFALVLDKNEVVKIDSDGRVASSGKQDLFMISVFVFIPLMWHLIMKYL